MCKGTRSSNVQEQKKWMSQYRREKRVCPSSTFSLYLGPQWIRLLCHVGEGLSSLHNLPIQMLISFGNKRTETMFYQLSGHTLSHWSHINHHKYLILSTIRRTAFCVAGHHAITYRRMTRLGSLKLSLVQRTWSYQKVHSYCPRAPNEGFSYIVFS